MKQKYIIKLSKTERSQLKELISSGEGSARQIRRAYILLKSDSSPGSPNWKYQEICEAYEVSVIDGLQCAQELYRRWLETSDLTQETGTGLRATAGWRRRSTSDRTGMQ